MVEKHLLALILLLFMLLGVVYAFVTPPFEASDELWHYPMVRHLADGNPLPVQVFDPVLAGPWKQEASQPPLYYYMGAALTFWIDTSDMGEVRRENPHVDNGLITEDGNTNLVIHNPDSDTWQGTLLALRLVRLMSVLMGALTIYLTYRIAGAAYPERPEIALGAAAVNGFLPMFLFVSGAVNNDNLAIMLSSLALFTMITIVARYKRAAVDYQPVLTSWRIVSLLSLGVVIGLALLTKEGAMGLLPMAWGTCYIVAWLEKPPCRQLDAGLGRTFYSLFLVLLRSLLYFGFVLLPVLLIAGWWYFRNWQLYGDWLGWSAFIAVLGQRAHPASLLQLWGERHGFLMAYWGLFGGVNIPMSPWIYSVFNLLLIISVVGFILVVVREIRLWLISRRGSWRSFGQAIDNLLAFVVQHFALVAAFLFAASVVIGLIRWATITWSSQGRLVFTAISALCALFMIGLAGWLPQRLARWVSAMVALIFLAIAAAAPFLWIGPAYDPDSYDLAQSADFQDLDVVFGDQIRLRGAALEVEGSNELTAEPGNFIWAHLDWEILSPSQRDWSVFVHAVDPVLGQPIAQRDMYLGQGLLLTSWLEPGTRIANSYRLRLPETAVSPADLEIVAGLYDVENWERLPVDAGGDSATVGTLTLQASSGEFPNPTSINFEDRFELVGYYTNPRSARPGETIDLDLYWRPLRKIGEDYTFFAQVIDEDTTRWASNDHAPPEGTSTWPEDSTQIQSMDLTLASDTPAGTYPIIVGIYIRDSEGNFNRLQMETPDGRLTEDFLELTTIRVE